MVIQRRASVHVCEWRQKKKANTKNRTKASKEVIHLGGFVWRRAAAKEKDRFLRTHYSHKQLAVCCCCLSIHDCYVMPVGGTGVPGRYSLALFALGRGWYGGGWLSPVCSGLVCFCLLHLVYIPFHFCIFHKSAHVSSAAFIDANRTNAINSLIRFLLLLSMPLWFVTLKLYWANLAYTENGCNR